MNYDDPDDLALPQRPQRPEPRPEVRPAAREDMAGEMEDDDRELTLSTGTVLALFFGLALLCAVFFGFGYSMGHKSAAAAVESAGANNADATGGTSAADTASKPSAGSPAVTIPSYQGQGAAADPVSRPAAAPTPKPAASVPERTVPAGTAVTLPLDPTVTPTPVKKPAADPDSMVVGEARPVAPAPKPSARTAADGKVVTAVPETAAPAGTGTVYVQVAAVSHKEDADTLLSALRRRGYSVFARNTDTDKLIHVQVGPFPTKKDAEAMRQRLIGDGYTPILK